MNPLLAPLLPIAIRQGQRLLGSLDEPEAPRDGTAGRIEGRPPTAKPLHLVLLGDEFMAGLGATQLADALPGTLARSLAERESRPVLWQTIAERGASSLRVHGRLVSQVSGAADVVVLGVGTNDLLARHTPTEWRDEMAATLDILRRHPRVVVLGCPPLNSFPRLQWPLSALLHDQAATFDEITRRLCIERGLDFVPWRSLTTAASEFHEDGFHLSEAGYRRLAGLLAAELVAGEPHDEPVNGA